MEVEEMINKVREQQGRAFNIKRLTTSCVANVIMSMLFGRRFDHSDPDFKQLISDSDGRISSYLMPVEMFPALRFLPYFKKLIAETVRSTKRSNGFVKDNIAACIEVCNSDLIQ